MLQWAIFSSAIESAKLWLANGNKLTFTDIMILGDMSFNSAILPPKEFGLVQIVSFEVIRGLQQYASARVKTLLGLE